MKNPPAIVLLLLLFICAQVLGLFVVQQYLVTQDYAVQPPTVDNPSLSWIMILAAVLIGTVLVFLLIKFKFFKLWKVWFGLSVALSVFLSLYPFFPHPLSYIIAGVLGIVIGILKVRTTNPWILNLSEVLMYGGIVALIVPIFNVFSGIVLLLALSVYDSYAVWKSRHMVILAHAQSKYQTFAGFQIGKLSYVPETKNAKRGALLGGGDIAFPLLFAAIVFQVSGSFWSGLLISGGAFVGLLLILLFGQKGKFYPAMPFITLGCLLAFLLL